MNKVTKFFMAALLAGICSLGYGQDYLIAPRTTEKVLGTVTVERATHPSSPMNPNSTQSSSTKQRWYQTLLEKAKTEYPGMVIDIRDLTVGNYYTKDSWGEFFYGPVYGKVVTLKTTEELFIENLPKAINKALRNVREGSRMAIDQVSVTYGMDKETLKDQLLDVLLDKGYKVIAKEYLEKLYEEQEAQQSGIYNENTTVKDNNFSAVG